MAPNSLRASKKGNADVNIFINQTPMVEGVNGEAFRLFCAHYRPSIQVATCGHISYQDSSRLLLGRWLALGAASIQIWHRKAEAKSLRCERELVAWGKEGVDATVPTDFHEVSDCCMHGRKAADEHSSERNVVSPECYCVGAPVRTPFGLGRIRSIVEVDLNCGNASSFGRSKSVPPSGFKGYVALLRNYISQYYGFPGVHYMTTAGVALGEWCFEQRRKRENGRMRAVHRDMLDELGFEWHACLTSQHRRKSQLGPPNANGGYIAATVGPAPLLLCGDNTGVEGSSQQASQIFRGSHRRKSYASVEVSAASVAEQRRLYVQSRCSALDHSSIGRVIVDAGQLTSALPPWPYPVVWHGHDVVEVWFPPGSIGLTLTEHTDANNESHTNLGRAAARIFRVGGFRRDGNDAPLPGERSGQLWCLRVGFTHVHPS